MLTLFSRWATEKSTGSPTSRIVQKQFGVERSCLGKHESALLGEIQEIGVAMNNELDESYIEIARGKYEQIKSTIS